MWCFEIYIAIIADICPTQVVCHNDNDVGSADIGFFRMASDEKQQDYIAVRISTH
jgi:hypothetical protein